MSETFRVTLDNMPVARIGDAWWDCRDDPPSRLPKSYFTDALDALAARERELAEARKSAEAWQEEARVYAQNAAYWQGIAEQARADLAAVEAENVELREVVQYTHDMLDGTGDALRDDGFRIFADLTDDLVARAKRALLAREADDGAV